jgi:MbtH protein
MNNPFEDENVAYLVLVNAEGQYSLWPDFVLVPAGWSPIGPRGNRKDCLDWIEKSWVDMRPLSLVRQMDGTATKDDHDSKV